VLPRDLEPSDLAFVSTLADDFILWPERIEVIRLRLMRFLVSDSEIQSAYENLMVGLAKTNLVGREPTFLRMADKIVMSASNGFPALITGETGTGKDLFARAIHFLSNRRSHPFVPVDCGGIPDHLFENELYGHVRGAYTDAHGEQRGLAALADKGTLFLDEIDSLSLAAQAKLLRFLEDHQFKPLGSERYLHSDVKIVAASNRSLQQQVAEKQFRADLFFRLNVLHLELPPLRERRQDIPLLAQHFLTLYLPAGVRKVFTPAALHHLMSYQWPGNIRELANVVQRAIVFSRGTQINGCDIAIPEAAAGIQPGTFRAARQEAIQSFEREYVGQLLRRNQGNITWAANEAGKERRAFGRLVKKYGAAQFPRAAGQP
jgi:DNA-binding NtrC family response regulator